MYFFKLNDAVWLTCGWQLMAVDEASLSSVTLNAIRWFASAPPEPPLALCSPPVGVRAQVSGRCVASIRS